MPAPRLREAALAAALALYDYHFLRRTAQAAGLFRQGVAPWLLCTGGVAHQGGLLETA